MISVVSTAADYRTHRAFHVKVSFIVDILHPVNEMDSMAFSQSHGQYFLTDSCRFLLPIANAIRVNTGQPRLPDGYFVLLVFKTFLLLNVMALKISLYLKEKNVSPYIPPLKRAGFTG